MFTALVAAFALHLSLLPAAVADAGVARPLPAAVTAVRADAPIRVTTLATGLSVAERALQGEATAFDLGAGRIYAHAELAVDAPGTVDMVWKRDGEVMQTMTLDVGKSRRWRTWSYRTLGKRDAGRWTVTLVDAAGSPLGEVAFEVSPIAAVGVR